MYNGVFDLNDRRVRHFEPVKRSVQDYQPGDTVYYSGEKFRAELVGKDGKPFKGWIHAAVLNQENVFVVEFPEAKESDYVLAAQFLTKAKPPRTERHTGPEVEIQPRRRKKTEDES